MKKTYMQFSDTIGNLIIIELEIFICISGVHVFQVDMCYESIRVKGGHALLEQMSWEGMCWWSPYLQDGISCNALCFTGRNFILDDFA